MQFYAGSNKDYIVVGSDSGKISIIEYDVALNDWKPVHCEVFGKSGCRRIVPGQYLAADPKGRALIIGEISVPFQHCSIIAFHQISKAILIIIHS